MRAQGIDLDQCADPAIARNGCMLSTTLYSIDKTNAGRKPIGVDHGVKRNRRSGSLAAPGVCGRWRSDLLTRAIETQVLPQLALAHQRNDIGAPAMGGAELDAFLALVLANDLPACIARVEQFAARGLGLADICLGVLTPAARRFGAMWDDDLCSFVNVTAGVGTFAIDPVSLA